MFTFIYYKYIYFRRILICGLVLSFQGYLLFGQASHHDEILCENIVEINKSQRTISNNALRAPLFQLIQQKATQKNKRATTTLLDALYHRGEKIKKDNWIKRFMLKKGRPYTLYDSLKTNASIASMNNYLFNQGFLDGYVRSKQLNEFDCISVIYEVFPGKRYKLNEIKITSNDTCITPFLKQINAESLLKEGRALSDELFRREFARIDKYLKNHGFAAFSVEYIRTNPSDTIGTLTNIHIEINPPKKGTSHQQYHIGNIHVYPDYNIAQPAKYDTIIDNIYFHSRHKRFFVPPQVILSKLKFRPDVLYRQEDYLQTYRGLSKLSAYRFVSLENVQHEDDAALLDYNILLTPDEKWSSNTGFGVSLARIYGVNVVRNNLLSINANSTLEDRNVNNSGLNISYGLLLSTELGLTSKRKIFISSNSAEASVNIGFPKYIAFPGTMHFLQKAGILSKSQYTNFIKGSTSGFNFTLSISDLPDFYSYTAINSNLEYKYKLSDREFITIQTLSLEYYKPDTGYLFTQITQGSEFAKKSFLGSRVFTSFFFKTLQYSYTNKTSNQGIKWATNGLIEQSGGELKLINLGYNLLSGQSKIWQINGSNEVIEFANYLRGRLDLKMYTFLNKDTYFAFRVGPGVVYAFGTQVVPYIKQFYVGGPLSNRAWNAREIGPGIDTISIYQSESQPFFATGDFKLDLNAEFRFKIWSFVEAAAFVDAANVWNLKENNPGHRLTWNFINEMAIGLGYGLRLDFGFLLLRADLGYKIITPYELNGTRWYYNANNRFGFRSLGDATLNIAVGMPF